MFVQVNLMCSKARTKKVIVGLAVVAVTLGGVFQNRIYLGSFQGAFMEVQFYTFRVVVPVTVLVINVVLIREVRRAANNAAANLGLQQHHQSTSSNSAVPTVMLITTSLVYVALRGSTVVIVYLERTLWTYRNRNEWFWYSVRELVFALSEFVFAYNFYVYLITGKQFRSELRTLFCRSSYPPSSSSATAATVYDRNNASLAGRSQADSAV